MTHYVLTVFVDAFTDQVSDTICLAINDHIETGTAHAYGLTFKGTQRRSLVMLGFRSESEPDEIVRSLIDHDLEFTLSDERGCRLPAEVSQYFSQEIAEKGKLSDELDDAIENEDYERAAKLRDKLNGINGEEDPAPEKEC